MQAVAMGLHGAYQVPAMLRQGVGCADELLHRELEETLLLQGTNLPGALRCTEECTCH